MKRSTIQIFPWQRPFLPDLKIFLERISNGHPGSVLLIAPHNRPWRYLTHLYAAAGYSGPLPHFLPLADAIALWRSHISISPLHQASELDRVAVLYDCLTMLAHEDESLCARFAHMDLARFLPWGLRLASILEEMLTHCLTAVDLAHVEEEVSPAAADLLGALGRIGKAYLSELQQRGWSTPGLDAFTVARHDGPVPPFFLPSPQRPVVMAGFALLSGSEDALLHRLWQAGAHMCLHADPALVDGTGQHWSCNFFIDLLRRWKAKAELAVEPMPQQVAHQPQISFLAGYDCHSQLQAMQATLADTSAATASTAIVLTDNTLLLPVLHHLPHKDVNISMGYPLNRSPLNRLLEAALVLCETRSEDGRFYWRHLLQCLHHPYLRLLSTAKEHDPNQRLRVALRHLEKNIRHGPRFVHWDALMADVQPTLPATLYELLNTMADHILCRPCAAATLNDMAVWILGLCDFLLRNGGDIWQHFPLDAEAMYRLARHIAPALRQNCLAHKILPTSTRHGIVRQLLQKERVPFEAEPLTGLQILGLLETRLLHFDRVFLLDATDDKLPGNPAQDPLLPDSLRLALGLPHAHGREQAIAYNLYRLCAGAQEVFFYWQEGITRSALFDGKKSRSRFVEQHIWQEERRRSTLLTQGQAPLHTVSCTIRPSPSEPAVLKRAQPLDRAMSQFLSAPLSATRMDVYQLCPLRFARQHLCHLEPLHEVNEKDDPAAVGICIHETLRTLFEPYLNKELHRGDISRETLQARFTAALEKADLRHQLPPDSCLMLEETAPVRLWSFLQNQPEITRIVALEKPLHAIVHLGDSDYAFTGIIDRLDVREGFLHILDYKTGTLKKHEAGLWTDAGFFQKMADLCKSCGASPPATDTLEELDTLFASLCSRLPSVQLPCYLVMAQAANMGALADAALVELRSSGKEYSLFDGLNEEERKNALYYCGLAINITLLHMRHMPFFAARQGKHCSWCPYAGLCAI